VVRLVPVCPKVQGEPGRVRAGSGLNRTRGADATPLAKEHRQRAALDQLRGETGTLFGVSAKVVDGHHARMLELAADLGLLDEAADQAGLVLVRFEQSKTLMASSRPTSVSRPRSTAGIAAAGDLVEDLVAIVSASLVRLGLVRGPLLPMRLVRCLRATAAVPASRL
jgi:hypothetical protein